MRLRAGALLRLLALACVLAVGGCGLLRRDRAASLDREAETYVRLVLALGDRDVDSLDSYSGPPSWRDEAHAANAPLDGIRASALALAHEIRAGSGKRGDDGARRQHLAAAVDAVVARIDLLAGRRTSFEEETRRLFGIQLPPIDRGRLARTRAELDRLLPGTGPLADRYAAFDRRFLVPPARLPALLARALDGCRRATLAHAALPPDERLSVDYVRDSPWSALTRYEGHARSRLSITADYALTVDRVLDLACHEGYPGHHVIDTWIDERLVQRRGWIEFAVQPRFTPDAIVREGAASLAPGLAFPGDERVAFERDVLFPLAGLDSSGAAAYVRVERLIDALGPAQLDVARRYLDGELEFVRAGDALRDEALMAAPDATLKFLNEFRTYAVTYIVGPELAEQWLATQTRGRGDAASRWRAYETLATCNPLSQGGPVC